MRALVIGHDHVSPSGLIGDRLAELGYALDGLTVVPAERHHAPDVGFDFPDPSAYDLLVLLGAPWSVYDRSLIGPWVDAELEMLRHAHESDIPVLAICFGAQALATALGGVVERAPRPEIGWTAIGTDVSGLIPEGPWFQWHFDRFMPPPGAVELARNAAGPQAFRIGRSLGVQFHPELTEETLGRWLALGGRCQAEEHGVNPDRLLGETRARREEARRRAYRLVDAFLAEVAGAEGCGDRPGH